MGHFNFSMIFCIVIHLIVQQVFIKNHLQAGNRVSDRASGAWCPALSGDGAREAGVRGQAANAPSGGPEGREGPSPVGL